MTTRLLPTRFDPYPGPHADPAARPGGWLAAVSLVLRPVPAGMELLLIRRAQDERDPWSGHMALPGGRKEAADVSLLETAVRETREEVGVDLGDALPPLGRLDPMTPMSPDLPPLTILPFVFAVSEGTRARIASPEVAAFHWVPLEHLRDNRKRTMFRFIGEGFTRDFPAIEVAGNPVWGLTHRILTEFLGRLRE